jgi:hypothetical protein
MTRLVSFDTETYLIGDRCKAPKPVCCTWAEGDKAWITRPEDPATYAMWADPDVVIVGQNIAYDIHVMIVWHPHFIPLIVAKLDAGMVFDTMTRECLTQMFTTGGTGYKPYHSLATMVQKYLGEDISKTKKGDDIWRLKYGTLDAVPFRDWPAEALAYAMDDATHTLRVFQAQGGLGGIFPTETLQVWGDVCLYSIGAWGWKINRPQNQEMQARQRAKINELQLEVGPQGWTGTGSTARLAAAVSACAHHRQKTLLYERACAAGVVLFWETLAAEYDNQDMQEVMQKAAESGITPSFVQAASPQAAYSWVCQVAQEIPPFKRTEKGKLSVDDETLAMYEDIQPLFKKFRELKHEIKMLSTYLEPFDVDVSHGRYTNLVSTGRTSCTPGHQTIPKDGDYREQFMPRPGYLFGTVDYSALELCTLAATIRFFYPNVQCVLGDLIDQNADLHCYMASFITGIDYETMLKNKKVEPYKTHRNGAKPANFGFNGGMGVNVFVANANADYGLHMTYDEGQNVREAWKKAYPEIDGVYLKNHKQLFNGPNGRRDMNKRANAQLINGRVKANCIYTELSNFKFQGLAADGAKRSMYLIWREIMLSWYYRQFPNAVGYGKDYQGSPLHSSHTAAFIHDELVMEHPASDEGQAAFKRQKELMIEGMSQECQRLITIRVGEGDLSEHWEK